MGWNPHKAALQQMGVCVERDTKCRCGSGKERYALNDAAGIFCRYVCDDCEVAVRKKYNPEIFRSGSRYAATGEEQDLEGDV